MGATASNVRRIVRRSLDAAARLTGLLQWHERRMRRRPTLLMFHRVLPPEQCRGYPFPSLVVSTTAFDRQIAHLARRARVLTAREAAAAPRDGGDRRPVVAVTFDDGYLDNYEHAAPILERHGVRGTFYVATGFVRGEPLWYDRAAAIVDARADAELEAAAAASGVAPPAGASAGPDRRAAWVEALKRSAPAPRAAWLAVLAGPAEGGPAGFGAMQPAQLVELEQRGHEVGSHTCSHEILPLLDDASLRTELRDSRRDLAQWLGREVEGFCYPNGDHDDRVVAAVREAGYSYAVTTRDPAEHGDGDVGAFRWPRIDMNPVRFCRDDGALDLTAFRAEISGLHARLR